MIAIDGEGSGPGTETDEEVYEGGKEEDALAAEETKDKESTKDMVDGGSEAESTSGTLKAKGDETKDKETNMDTDTGGTAANQRELRRQGECGGTEKRDWRTRG